MKARLASQNRHKLTELRAALPGWDVELLDAAEFPPEEGRTYYDNARAKALFGRTLAGRDVWVLGEDSGIEVDALDGRPGVESARWAPEPVSALLDRLQGVDGRRARYVCELVAVSPRREEFRGTGTLDGTIAVEARGSEGFGYDPIFVPDGEARTVAELGDEWKRARSHRARAAQALLEAIAGSTSARPA